MGRLRKLLTATWLATAAPALAAPPDLASRVEAAIAAAPDFAGEILVGDKNQVLFERAFGIADRSSNTPHRIGQTWRWASVSKQVTAALVMAEVDAGRLELDDPVAGHLPGFKGATASRITVRHLLQHTSGLPNPSDGDPVSGFPSFYLRTGPGVGGTRDALGYCAGWPKKAPGEQFEYNNCDTIVLGAILQKTSGKPFRELLAERVVRPLGATNIRVATSGMPGVRGYTSAGTIEPAANLATWGPGGAIVGTARDLLAFDRALLARSIVSEPSTKLMWTGEPRLGYVALGAWSFPAPLAGCSKPVALVERRGAIGGVQVRNVLAPAIGRALIVFTNSEAVDFGEVWQGKGLSHALLSAAFCDG